MENPSNIFEPLGGTPPKAVQNQQSFFHDFPNIHKHYKTREMSPVFIFQVIDLQPSLYTIGFLDSGTKPPELKNLGHLDSRFQASKWKVQFDGPTN